MSLVNVRRGVAVVAAVAVLALTVGDRDLSAAQKSPGGGSTAKRRTANKPVAPEPKTVRMPAHFGKVANDEQRAKILDIQKDYMPKIEQKRAELQELLDKRDAAFFDVLTAAQKRQVEELRALAAAKRAASLADNSTAASDAPAEPAKKPKSPKSEKADK